MNVIDAIKKRKSVRNFLKDPVENEKLLKILDAARLAPSAFNLQEWRFIVVRMNQTKEMLIKTAKVPAFIADAPVVLIACAKPESCTMHYGQPCYPVDVAIALDHITLAAVEYGLGSCWIGIYDEKKVKEILGIPENVRVIAVMPLGYPSDESTVDKKRFQLDQIVKYDYW